VLPDTSSPADLQPLLIDMHMLAVLGGRERSEQQYRALLAAAGLELVRRSGTGRGPDVLEAAPAS
jgi:hypothetical protein